MSKYDIRLSHYLEGNDVDCFWHGARQGLDT